MTLADISGILPLLILAVGAVAVLLTGALAPGGYGTAVAVATLVGAGAGALLISPEAATIGVSFTPFSRFFTVLFVATGLVVLLLSHDYNRRRGIFGEEYPATVLFGIFGMAVVSSASNLLILFLGLEGLTFAFYFLVAIDRERPESGEAGLKYLVLGASAAAFTAFGVALLYAGTGVMEIEGVRQALALRGGTNPLVVAGFGFLLAGMAFKISLVPAHLWTPDVYEGGPTPVVAFLSTASKGAAVVFLLLLLPLQGLTEPLRGVMWMLSLLSMVVGNLAALLQKNLKRMLAYSAIAQMGYVTLALLSGSRSGYGAAAFYLVAYTAMNLAAFGAVSTLTDGEEAGKVEDYRGLGYSRPFPAGVLAFSMFSLAGIPPTAGFMGKFFIFAAALRGGETSLAVIGILTAAASIYYYLGVVVNLYMRPADTSLTLATGTAAEKGALACAAFFILILGIFPAALIDYVGSLFR